MAPSLASADLTSDLRRHVERLAGEIGERNVWRSSALHRAASYISAELRSAGYTVVPQTYDARGVLVSNLEAARPGGLKANEVVVVGAHYDSVQGSPGANDNASGVAALLEIARVFSSRSPARTLRFVAFANEEPPYFQTEQMGSLIYARRAKEEAVDVVAMLSLESIGYYDDSPGSQRYPFPLNWFYPDRGNFIGFVGNRRSRELVKRCARAFGRATKFPMENAAVPEIFPGVGWSDHWSFWQQGVPAVMVTDTALFRDPTYHTPHDTVEHLRYDHMAEVVRGLFAVVEDLVDR